MFMSDDQNDLFLGRVELRTMSEPIPLRKTMIDGMLFSPDITLAKTVVSSWV